MAEPDPLLVLPVILSTLWIVFLLFYASRLLAAVVQLLANLCMKDSGIHIGSLHINLLAGRVVFKDLHYYCRDYSIRITDGYVSVRWCAACFKSSRDCSKCTSASKGTLQRRSPVLFFQLNGLEYHWYNRSEEYDNWGRSTTNENSESTQDQDESSLWRWWKKTQPSLHFTITKGRILLGNHLTEYSLALYFTKAEAHYSTAEGSTPYDELMHVVDCYAETIKVVTERSHGYKGPTMEEEPPVVCEGTEDSYLFLKTDSAHVRYSLDSPGLVPLGETQPPKFAFDVVLGENSVINYGSYANRLRPCLQQFFFPNDYVVKAVTSNPGPGEKRIFTRFDISLSLSSEAEFYLLFSNNKGTPQHLKIGLGPPSTLIIHTPLTTNADGYSSTIQGDLSGVKVSSSLDYPSLGQADSVSFLVDLHFPRVWNATQTWDMRFTGRNAQVNILFSYIDYVNALLDDWLGDEEADLLNFVPYNWRIHVDLLNYEIFLFTNRYNWVDIAPEGIENNRLAFCGTTGQITFHFPFTEFIPPEQKVHFTAKGQNIVVRRYLPPSSSTRDSLLSLSSENKHRWRVLGPPPSPPTKKSSKSKSSSPSQRSKLTVSKGSSLAGSERTLDKDKEQNQSSEHVITAPVLLSPSQEPTPKLGGGAGRHQIVSGITLETSIGGSGSLLEGQGATEGGGGEEEKTSGNELGGAAPGDQDNELFPMGYCGVTRREGGWIDLACGPSISIAIDYHSHNHDVGRGHSTPLAPNLLNIDVDAPVVLLRVFGCLGRDLLALKENYPGEYINLTVFNSDIPSQPSPERPQDPPLIEAPPPNPPDVPDTPQKRTLNVTCTFELSNITAEFPMHVPARYPGDFPLPSASTNLFRVYVEYLDLETKVWLHVDPVTVHLPSMVSNSQFEMGHAMLNGVDFRCHGLTEFLCGERVEYAWLMQLAIGRIAGAFSTQQLLSAVDWLYTSFMHVSSLGDGCREAPDAELIQPKVDEYAEIIKYKLFDLNITEADIHVMEDSTITRLQSPGFDLGMCTLHSAAETLGLSLQLQGLTATTYVPLTSDPCHMLEVGHLDVGNIQGDLHLREQLECVRERQVAFLERADASTKRLWFLWRDKTSSDIALCGCCGGCLFLNGSIERQLPRDKLQSAVYCQLFPSLHDNTLSRHLGLQPLKKALLLNKAYEVDCIRNIHRGLLDHYNLRYGTRVEVQNSMEASPQEASSDSRQSLSLTSDGSFVSARSSLTSFLDDDQFVSLQNINEAGMEGVAPGGWSLEGVAATGGWNKHRKKPSVDLRPLFIATKDAEPDGEAGEGEDNHADYGGVLPSQSLRLITLPVPLKKKGRAGSDSELRPPVHPAVVRMRSAPESASANSSPYHRIYSHSNVDPKGQPALAIGGRGSFLDPKNSLKLVIPVLRTHSNGCVPAVVQRDSARPRERKRRGRFSPTHEEGEGDESKLSTVSLGVHINGRLSLSLTPLMISFLDKVVNAAGGFFGERSASFVLDSVSHDSSAAVNSHLVQLLKEHSFNQPQDKPHPLLHLTVAMAPAAFASVQLLQTPKHLTLNHTNNGTSSISLKEVARHSSLLVCYASGIGCDALLETASEFQETVHNKSRGEEREVGDQVEERDVGEGEGEGEEGTKARTKINSFKLSTDMKVPVVQLAVCALVPEEDKAKRLTLPSLSQAQSQLHFQLNNLPPITEEGEPRLAVCVLLEAGIRESTATCVAEIVHSELSEEIVLTWRNVQEYQLQDVKKRPMSEECQEKKNRVVFSASLPLFWSQLASTHTGIATSSTGGIDMLILLEAMEAWQGGVEQLISSAQSLLANKALREKQVLLILIANAAKMPLTKKAGIPVHSNISSTLRQTVVYCCLHQLWKSLPIFSEDQLPPTSPDQERESNEREEGGDLELQLLAAMLALSARSFLKQEQFIIKKKRLKQSVIELSRGIDCSSCGPLSPRPTSPASSETSSEVTVGYVSISPSPSDLALPNTVYSSHDNLLDNEVDYSPILSKLQYSSLVILREALLPFYLMSGLQVDPQLRTLCHNSAEYFFDLTVEVREVTVFVCKNIDIKSASPIPIMTSQLVSSNPSLIGEQLAVSGCVRYCTSPQLGWARRSKCITLLKPSSYQEQRSSMKESSSQEEGGEENKTNISCKCCISLDNLNSTVTTPLLKLTRHMTETARFRAKLRKEAKIRAEDLVPTPRPPLGDDEIDCRVPLVCVENSVGAIPLATVRPSMAERFAQNLVHKFVSLEQDVVILPQAKDSGNATPTSTSSTNVRILEYVRSPKVEKSQAVTPAQDTTKPSTPIGYTLLEGSGGGPIRFSDRRRLSTTSNTSKSSREEVAVTIEEVDTPPDHAHNNNTSPEEVLSTQDTYGEDTTDLLSSDVEGDTAKTRKQRVKVRTRTKDASSRKVPSDIGHTHHHSPLKVFLLSEGELLYSIFGLLRINRIGCDVQIETTRLSLELNAISAAVDVRKSLPAARPHSLSQQRTPSVDELDQLLHFDLLPTYLSVSATLRKSLIRVNDRGLPESDILLFSALPVYGSVGVVNHTHQKVPIYRCLLKFAGLDVDIKQSPVRVHRRYQQLLPAFTKIYNDVFASSSGEAGGVLDEAAAASIPVETTTSISKITSLKLPSHLPRGVIHFKIDRTNLIMAPLTSLTVTYSVSPVMAQVETSSVIGFQFGVGEHKLRFSPKEQYKDELSLRSLTLPVVNVKGEVTRRPRTKTPQVAVELGVKMINIDLTTDVLNQLLILQNTFIKELNDLLQTLLGIGESIPHRQRLKHIKPEAVAGNGIELLSFLDSFQFSLSGIAITVSTPLGTAIRFSTGKIEMHLTNTSHPVETTPIVPLTPKTQFSLVGRVEIDIVLALGYLQDVGPDIVDDLCELAHFKTRISIRNTFENIARSSIPVAGDDVDGAEHSSSEGVEPTVEVDTFLINILSPHLYIQSTAVEQAILFWLNCKSVYTYWQNERKLLTAEVQAATEALIEKIQRPTQLQTPSIDFSKPRLVQITVTDVGACMPLQPMAATPHSQQKSFPALVVTIREMHFLLNLSRKVASTGRFQTFCIRFADQFYLRQKTWTLDPKRHKFINYAIINQGTFRLCIANKKRFSETEPEKELGEKLLWAFQWNMSGIDVNASTDIGRHISTLVRTVTTIGSDMDNTGTLRRIKSAATVTSPKPPQARVSRKGSAPSRIHHRRAHSLVHHTRGGLGNDPQTLALEQELARQTRKVQKLKSSGATGDSLRSEEERLRRMEQELAKKVHRMFRHPREGISLHQFNQIFSPWPMTTKERGGSIKKLSTAMRKRLFSLTEEAGGEGGERGVASLDQSVKSATLSPSHKRRRTQSVATRPMAHKRVKSDITGLLPPGISPQSSTSPSISPCPTPPPWEDGAFEGEGGVATTEDRPSSGSGLDDRPSSSGSGVDVNGKEGERVEEESSFIFPSIDVEVDITISVEYGIIKLQTEESDISGHRFSIPTSDRTSHTRLTVIPSEPYSGQLYPGKPSSIETVILIPALTVKAHYQSIVGRSYSTHKAPPASSPRRSPAPVVTIPTHHQLLTSAQPTPSKDAEDDSKPALPVKKGILSVSAVVASLPEDIKLTPSLLEFIERVATPTIAATVVTSSSSGDSDVESGGEDGGDHAPQQQTAESWPISFPVHVTLAFQIQPSTVYLTCRPHSRVECIIQSPDVNFIISFSLFCPQGLEGAVSMSGGSPPDSLSLHSSSLQQSKANIVAFNNLYITGCLRTFVLQLYSPQVSTLKQPSREPAVEKKEALSLTLGQAFIHLSRKSVLALMPGAGRGVAGKGRVRSVDDYKPHNKLQVSVIPHIASLVLGYDMRRLNDITAFRRYWYSTSLIETLFIGSKSKPGDDAMTATPTEVKNSSVSEEESMVDIDNTISATIAVAANVADFRVAANFAQVMGHADLLVTHLKLEGHADISHNELVLLQVDTKLDKGELDARGGVIAGAVLVENIQAHLVTHSEQDRIPEHRGVASIGLIEGRIEYMSSAIVLARATLLSVELYDEWEGLQFTSDPPSDVRSQLANIQVNANFTWDGLQIAINRSTTKNAVNIVQKLYDFVMQQKRRSERTISLMLPTGSAASKALQAYREEQRRAEEQKTDQKEDMRHHWLWAVKVGSVELMKTLGIHFPDDSHLGVSLGGKITIQGQNLCIVCFHGPSFRENEWAVFNIDQVHSSFSTQAIPGLSSLSQAEEGVPYTETHIRTCQQIVNLILGHKDEDATSSLSELAAIYRVSGGRSRVPPVASTPIQNWLTYVCIDSHIHPDKYTTDNSTLVRLSRKLTIHPLLIMPSFSVELINDHFWPRLTQDTVAGREGVTPRVECSLISTFDQPGIAVTTTVDHYLFLHDLVKAYVDYFEKHKAPLSTGILHLRSSLGYDIPSPSVSPEPSSELPTAATPTSSSSSGHQGRQFECVCWELDPHLLLLSTVSGQFNPHISWVLERLGFKHARTTIPKWVQRGAMDPLDFVVASVLELLVKLTASKKLRLKTANLPASSDEAEDYQEMHDT